MTSPIVFALVGAVALLVGLVVGWFLSRSQAKAALQAQVDSAVAAATGQLTVELATLKERALAASQDLAHERKELEAARGQTAEWRQMHDDVSKLVATYKERAARVPELEAALKTAADKAEDMEVNLRQLSNQSGRHEAKAHELAQQLQDIQAELDSLQESHARLNSAVQKANEERAGFEQQALRVPELEREVEALKTQLGDKESELLRVSTNNGSNSAKVSELTQQLQGAQLEVGQASQRVEQLTQLLQAANEQRAGFEQQALRVPGLEQTTNELRISHEATREELANLRESTSRENAQLTESLRAAREAHAGLQAVHSTLNQEHGELENKFIELEKEMGELRVRAEQEHLAAEAKLTNLLEAKQTLSDQFKSLANDILEEKAKRFTEQNQNNLGQLLEPLKNQLNEFKGKVEQAYHEEGMGRTALSEQVKQLALLNQTLSEDAKNLARALKGQAKTQGNWGELILERVLQASGLRRDFEYKVQDSQTREDGSRAQPDVVLELPENRCLVIDAKVSLVAYERYVNAETDEERAQASRQHLDSVRSHIKGLSEKRYQELYQLQTLDFVIAFVPVEPAFMLAVTADGELFMDAWNRNVLLVSPSTLLFVVRTVAHLWRQEAQNRNAQEIARKGAALYDKFAAFTLDLKRVGEQLGRAQDSYGDAMTKLTGKGGAVRLSEQLRDLGVKSTKQIHAEMVQKNEEAEDTPDAMLPGLALPSMSSMPLSQTTLVGHQPAAEGPDTATPAAQGPAAHG